MRRAAIAGRELAVLHDVPMPALRPGWALVKVHAAPMCVEYKRWLAGSVVDALGHEAAGEVVETRECARVQEGDRVVVHPLFACGRCATCEVGDYIYCEHQLEGDIDGEDGTLAEYVAKPEWLLTASPDDLSFRSASLACCALGPTFGAMERLGVGPAATVLLTGLGPVGLGGVANARARGATVVAVEPSKWRRQKAVELGASLALDPGEEVAEAVLDLTGGRGVDFAVDCSGAPAAHRLGIDLVRRRGGVAWVGESASDTALQASRDVIEKGLILIGNWHYPRPFYPKLIELIRRMSDPDELISHTYRLDDVQSAMATIAGQEAAKVVIEPWV